MTLLLNLSKKQLLCNLYGYYDYPLQQAFLSRQLGTLQYTLLLLVSVSVYFKQHLKLEIGGPAWGTILYQITILCRQESHFTVVVAQR